MRDDLHQQPVTDKPTLLSRIADWTVLVIAVGAGIAGAVFIIGGLFGLFGCSLFRFPAANPTPMAPGAPLPGDPGGGPWYWPAVMAILGAAPITIDGWRRYQIQRKKATIAETAANRFVTAIEAAEATQVKELIREHGSYGSNPDEVEQYIAERVKAVVGEKM